MPTFAYVARNAADGKRVEGTLNAESPRHAMDALDRMQLMPVEVKESKGGGGAALLSGGRRVPRREVTAMFRQLADLLRAETRRTEVELSQVDESLRAQLEPLAVSIEDEDDRCVLVVEGGDGARPVLEAAIAGGATVLGVTPMRETLEDVFVRDAL